MLAGVERQLNEAQEALIASAEHAKKGEYDPAYRVALLSRNLLFHAVRGVAAARGEPLPEMPVVAVLGGSMADFALALEQLNLARSAGDDLAGLKEALGATYPPYARYLGWLRKRSVDYFAAGDLSTSR